MLPSSSRRLDRFMFCRSPMAALTEACCAVTSPASMHLCIYVVLISVLVYVVCDDMLSETLLFVCRIDRSDLVLL